MELDETSYEWGTCYVLLSCLMAWSLLRPQQELAWQDRSWVAHTQDLSYHLHDTYRNKCQLGSKALLGMYITN